MSLGILMRTNTHTYISRVTPSTDMQGHTSSGHLRCFSKCRVEWIRPAGMPRGTHSHVYTHTHTNTCAGAHRSLWGKALFFQEQAGKPKLALCWMVVVRPYGQRLYPHGPPAPGAPQQPSAEAGVPRMGLELTDSLKLRVSTSASPVSCFCSYNRGCG